MKIILANPRGFCAGVSRAVDVVERVLALEPHPVYVRHEVVHNRAVVESLKEKGAVFVKELNEVPDHAVCIFSAHGVSQAVEEEAKSKELKIYDATCPLVTKVHREVQKASNIGVECVLIGHKGHPEVEGTLGQYKNNYSQIYLVENVDDVANLDVQDPTRLIFATQTTLSVDETKDIIAALKLKYPTVSSPKKEDICYATQNRQNAVRELAKEVDILLVVGSKNSSNSNRLRELAEKEGVSAYLIDNKDDINLAWFAGKHNAGITAGASAPEYLVQQVVGFLQEHFADAYVVDFEGVKEEVIFPLPKLLKQTKLGGVKNTNAHQETKDANK
ncbi:4-hydroxy-3-methylbut-2-enyl diphosphate reductase [Cysteiniphilum halobium]|uniref:4-hydroxy-3-methylbut-2-enyl diphosphate reductase n=1 Tax=Cysteiniphilum halobium TaxID=2219059 RepID=UPI000E6483BC|nr:4-hydroxy-3-methylbut-2-enyl diphosphate reductase [Cysteiniphilum halobium]